MSNLKDGDWQVILHQGYYRKEKEMNKVRCLDCGWEGELKECNWNYIEILPEENGTIPHCPKCDSDHLENSGQEKAL